MSRKENLLGSFGISKDEHVEHEVAQVQKKSFIKEKQRQATSSSIMFYGDSSIYAKLRAKELKTAGFTKGKTSVSEYIEWLIDNDKKENPKLAMKARQLYELEK